MRIETPEVKRTVTDYDFIFESGMTITYTIDPTRGDTITLGPNTVSIHLSAKPSLNNPDTMLAAEDIIVYVPKLACLQSRDREVVELSEDQKDEFRKTFNSMTTASARTVN